MNKIIIYLISLLLPLLLCAQTDDAISLQDCIEMALQNNPEFTSSKLAAETSSINFKQNKNALLPSINGNYNLGVAEGRSIDPFTNDFINEELTFSNLGVNLNATIFNGFNLVNQWKQAKLNLQASQMEVEAAKQNLILNVTLAYLQVLNSRELVKLSKNRVLSTEEQLNRLKSLFEEESGSPAAYRDLQGQFANDKAAVINSKNALDLALIDLNRLVNSNDDINQNVQEILLDDLDYKYTFEEVYVQALGNFPDLKASDLRVQATEKSIAVARSQYVPEISFFANLNTNYSSAARLFNDSGTVVEETGDFVTFNGTDVPVLRESTTFESAEIGYRDQFENNLSTSYGLAVRIPIFNGFNAKNNAGLEKIRNKQAQVELNQTQLDLKQAIKTSYTTMVAARENYKLLEEQVAAYEESLRINNVLFENGASNSTDYILSKNTLENARISLTNIKYSYALRIKILEYYRIGIN
ncbi:TolC family protein [Nonlabens agnitus]|uniref:Transporter n=1 Tax=Nonlabens agnitus TaxID=870484 RepID=A0A2S9WS09_9FLAO|nr:TolC family protein [Nonlabens agnitus]PRP66245.1 transporter [Nonlabens agnitus]